MTSWKVDGNGPVPTAQEVCIAGIGAEEEKGTSRVDTGPWEEDIKSPLQIFLLHDYQDQ